MSMYEHFKGEEVFVKKILEYKDQVLYKQRLVLTKFLNPREQEIVTSIIGNDEDIQVVQEGGFGYSENKRMIIAPSFYQIEKNDFEIEIVKVQYGKHFDTLKHSDVLGALMSLGIKRDVFGDIVEEDGDIYIAIEQSMVMYFKDHLQQIKRSKVKLVSNDKAINNTPQFRSRTFFVSSYRLDKVVSVLYGISRAKAAEYIRAGFVKVNHKNVVEIHYLCNNKDILSLKKHGRVLFEATDRVSKSNNHVVIGHFYI